MNPKQLRELVIRPTLHALGMWSQAAEDLMLGTACQESHCGKYIRQVGCSGNIGAFGIWQMEIATARDIYDNYLQNKAYQKGNPLILSLHFFPPSFSCSSSSTAHSCGVPRQ